MKRHLWSILFILHELASFSRKELEKFVDPLNLYNQMNQSRYVQILEVKYETSHREK